MFILHYGHRDVHLDYDDDGDNNNNNNNNIEISGSSRFECGAQYGRTYKHCAFPKRSHSIKHITPYYIIIIIIIIWCCVCEK